MTSKTFAEPILDPDLPIIDAHHHLWFQSEAALAAQAAENSLIVRLIGPTYRRYARYLLDEFLEDAASGHNIVASIYCTSQAMIKATGPEQLRSVGEVEFANGVAAMAASGNFGQVKACAGIIGGVDLRLGEAAEAVLEAHIKAGGGRYRGLRSRTLYDEDTSILGPSSVPPHTLLDPKFRAGFKCLAKLGLSYDALILDPQLPDLIDLARAFPDTQIILNHVGVPLGIGRFSGKRAERFPIWRENMRELAHCNNVAVKLGGLGIAAVGLDSFNAQPPYTSEQLAREWRPYIETCIEAFSENRCMFESNFPVDTATCSYPVLWNTFKRIASGASKEEKAALFGGTARRVYRLDAEFASDAKR